MNLETALSIANSEPNEKGVIPQLYEVIAKAYGLDRGDVLVDALLENEKVNQSLSNLMQLRIVYDVSKSASQKIENTIHDRFGSIEFLKDTVSVSQIYPSSSIKGEFELADPDNQNDKMVVRVGDKIFVGQIHEDSDYEFDEADIGGKIKQGAGDLPISSLTLENRFYDLSSPFLDSKLNQLFTPELINHYLQTGELGYDKNAKIDPMDMFASEKQAALDALPDLNGFERDILDEIVEIIDNTDFQFDYDYYLEGSEPDQLEIIDSVKKGLIGEEGVFSDLSNEVYDKVSEKFLNLIAYDAVIDRAINDARDEDLLTTSITPNHNSITSNKTTIGCVLNMDADEISSRYFIETRELAYQKSGVWIPSLDSVTTIGLKTVNEKLTPYGLNMEYGYNAEKNKSFVQMEGVDRRYLVEGHQISTMLNVAQMGIKVKGVEFDEADFAKDFFYELDRQTLSFVDEIGKVLEQQPYLIEFGSIELPSESELAVLAKYNEPIALYESIDFESSSGYLGEDDALACLVDYASGYIEDEMRKMKEQSKTKEVQLDQLQDEAYSLILDSTDIAHFVYNYSPKLPDFSGFTPSGITGVVAETIEGEVANMWVTTSSKPYDLSASYTKTVDNGQMVFKDSPLFVMDGQFTGNVELNDGDKLVIKHSGKEVAFDMANLAKIEVPVAYMDVERDAFSNKVKSFAQSHLIEEEVGPASMGYLVNAATANFHKDGIAYIDFESEQTKSGQIERLTLEKGVDYFVSIETELEDVDIAVGDKVTFKRPSFESEWKVGIKELAQTLER